MILIVFQPFSCLTAYQKCSRSPAHLSNAFTGDSSRKGLRSYMTAVRISAASTAKLKPSIPENGYKAS
jgi:hypothetical protein